MATLNRPGVQVWQIREKSTPGLLSDQTPEISVISNFLLRNLVLRTSSKTAVKSTSSASYLQRELRFSYKEWVPTVSPSQPLMWVHLFRWKLPFICLETAEGKKATLLFVTNINDSHIKYSKQKPWSKQNQHLFLIHLFTRLLHGFHKRTHIRDTWVNLQNQICKPKW